MGERGLTDFRRCGWVGNRIVTEDEVESSNLLFTFRDGKLVERRWTPPAGAVAHLVWAGGLTPEPLTRVWTLAADGGCFWSAKEFPFFPEDFQRSDGFNAAISLAVQAVDQTPAPV